ncbi:hypothetical protein L596_013792 [Steinernema carpocapsae]|uniref:Uncharacterized protein n=1 Tax=Steinernema carpocapsae TaxID=34508 RepID=A0A4V6A5B9_STECR|nr:hypothetical protein L596_013792 [Steinernema carpocapsae]
MMSVSFLLLLFSVIFLLLLTGSAAFSCKGDDGKDVSWFVIEAMQKINEKKFSQDVLPNPNVDLSMIPSEMLRGARYLYADKDHPTPTLSMHALDSKTSGSLPQTMTQHYSAYRSNADHFFIKWNDEMEKSKKILSSMPEWEEVFLGAGKCRKENGHLKGYLFGSETEGTFVLILVSTPTFGRRTIYKYSEHALRNAQQLVCLTLSRQQAPTVLNALYLMNAGINRASIPPWLLQGNNYFEIFNDATQREKFWALPANTPNLKTNTLTTIDGTNFRWFVKPGTATEGNDIYRMVAENLGTSLWVRTWKTKTKDTKKCNTAQQLMNIHQMSFLAKINDKTTVNITPATGKDHTKECYSTDPTKPWVCWCDLNREKSQYCRGGGCLCLEHGILWKYYTDSILRKDVCAANEPPLLQELLDENVDEDENVREDEDKDEDSFIVRINLTYQVVADSGQRKEEL